jgi:hypothetical protein
MKKYLRCYVDNGKTHLFTNGKEYEIMSENVGLGGHVWYLVTTDIEHIFKTVLKEDNKEFGYTCVQYKSAGMPEHFARFELVNDEHISS